MSLSYRAEIDGLRALAIIPVVCFHAGILGMSGGYIGVDIFFVISGFLITSLINKEMHDGNFSYVSFYERRIRRIAPALFFAMLCSLPFAYFLFAPFDTQKYTQSLAAIALLIANHSFANEVGYFDKVVELKPFIHSWSLSVEEQFYLFFPLILLISKRFFKSQVIYVLLILFILSYCYAGENIAKDNEDNYFLLPSRAWELLLGSIAATLPHIKISIYKSEAIGFFSLGIIISCFFIFDERSHIPGYIALLPTLATALILLFVQKNSFVAKLLSIKPVVFIGLISFSLYIWHQPLLAFIKYLKQDQDTQLVDYYFPMLFFISIASWRFIERPFRNTVSFNKKTVFLLFIFFTSLFICIGLFGASTQGHFGRLPNLQKLSNIPTVKDARCLNQNITKNHNFEINKLCQYGEGVPDTIIYGDSHAAALFEALSIQLNGRPFYASSGSGCAPLGYKFSSCVDRNDAILQFIANNSNIHNVVLVAEWAMYTKGFRDDADGKMISVNKFSDAVGINDSETSNELVFRRSFNKTIELLKNKHIFVIEPVPEFHSVIYSTIGRGLLREKSDVSMIELKNISPQITKTEYLNRNKEVLSTFAQNSDIHLISIQDIFCSASTCWPVNGDSIYYSDTNHLNFVGASQVAKRLVSVLPPKIN